MNEFASVPNERYRLNRALIDTKAAFDAVFGMHYKRFMLIALAVEPNVENIGFGWAGILAVAAADA
jgi:hypothetical protein